MTTPTELRALADEVEGLTGPSREMDVRIEVALGATRDPDEPGHATVLVPDKPGWRRFQAARPLTASIDAAAGLMPEGWRWASIEEKAAEIGGWKATVLRTRPIGLESGIAATEPLARCAAALRARAALIEASAAADGVA